jgi:hypothetical protein
MQRDLLRGDELLGDIETFTAEQRKARETFLEQQLHLPREWLCEDGCFGFDASVEGRIATGIYNVLFESDPRFADGDKCPIRGSFADVIRTGGDALLWALIRIALEEIGDEHLAELCENRGFIVRLPRKADAAA